MPALCYRLRQYVHHRAYLYVYHYVSPSLVASSVLIPDSEVRGSMQFVECNCRSYVPCSMCKTGMSVLPLWGPDRRLALLLRFMVATMVVRWTTGSRCLLSNDWLTLSTSIFTCYFKRLRCDLCQRMCGAKMSCVKITRFNF